MRLFCSLLLGLFLIAGRADALGPAPGDTLLPGYVVDAAKILTAAERATLTSRLADFEKRTRHQLVIVTVSSLGGDSIEAFSLRLFNRWKIGRYGVDDGVMILVAPTERQTRIAVGRGIEAQLTDRKCLRIIEEKMLPHFAAGRFANGMADGSAAVIAALP